MKKSGRNDEFYTQFHDIEKEGEKYIQVKRVRWFTNIDHSRLHQPMPLMTMAKNLRFSKHKELRSNII
jgi:hypothetical protein